MSEKSVAVLKRFVESKVGIRRAGCAFEGVREGVEDILSLGKRGRQKTGYLLAHWSDEKLSCEKVN